MKSASIIILCDLCEGRGTLRSIESPNEVSTDKIMCPNCSGTGRLKVTRTVEPYQPEKLNLTNKEEE
jgi:DnaJ-class molecular chaperone